MDFKEIIKKAEDVGDVGDLVKLIMAKNRSRPKKEFLITMDEIKTKIKVDKN